MLILVSVVNSLIPSANLVLDSKLKPPGDVQARLLRQIVLSGLGDHVARLVLRLVLQYTHIRSFLTVIYILSVDKISLFKFSCMQKFWISAGFCFI